MNGVKNLRAFIASAAFVRSRTDYAFGRPRNIANDANFVAFRKFSVGLTNSNRPSVSLEPSLHSTGHLTSRKLRFFFFLVCTWPRVSGFPIERQHSSSFRQKKKIVKSQSDFKASPGSDSGPERIFRRVDYTIFLLLLFNVPPSLRDKRLFSVYAFKRVVTRRTKKMRIVECQFSFL